MVVDAADDVLVGVVTAPTRVLAGTDTTLIGVDIDGPDRCPLHSWKNSR